MVKTCNTCGQTKPDTAFKLGHHKCQSCSRPMSQVKDCALYLGVHIAERALSGFFDNIIRMPANNPGFDFICGRGFKIDVKSACRTFPGGDRTGRWQFCINRNKIADYFLCLAFDSRESLEPQHVWLIPGADINKATLISVNDDDHGTARYAKYERSLDRVVLCCDKIKVSATCEGHALN